MPIIVWHERVATSHDYIVKTHQCCWKLQNNSIANQCDRCRATTLPTASSALSSRTAATTHYVHNWYPQYDPQNATRFT